MLNNTIKGTQKRPFFAVEQKNKVFTLTLALRIAKTKVVVATAAKKNNKYNYPRTVITTAKEIANAVTISVTTTEK